MIININVKNKIATAAQNYVVVCGNSDYKVKFTFDSEWDSYDNKTARFSYVKDGVRTRVDTVFNGDTCDMPILSNVKFVEIGVFAGDLSATSPCVINCQKSILCEEGLPEDPPVYVYNQIMRKCNEAIDRANSAEERAKNANKIFSEAVKGSITSIGPQILSDISTIEHDITVDCRNPSMLDEGANVKVYRRPNLLNLSECTIYSGELDENNSIIQNVVEDEYGGVIIEPSAELYDIFNSLRQPTQFTISCSTRQSGFLKKFYIAYSDGEEIELKTTKTSETSIVFEIDTQNGERAVDYMEFYPFTKDEPFSSTKKLEKIRVDVGNFNFDYMDYVAPETYTFDSDGIISIPSSPIMVVSPYANTFYLKYDYNRDINKVIEELQNAILSLQGNT